SQFSQDKHTVHQKDLETMYAAYAQFEELRAEFLSASASSQEGSFYKVKEQAITVLAAAHYSERTEKVWALAEYVAPQPQSQPKPTVQAARLKK
ncbi:MAG: hypothetical protein ACRD2P_01710, partial [Terriglobia bacterium]